MVSFYKIGLVCILFLFLVSVSGVCAVDLDTNNTDSLTTVEDNNLQLNNYTVLSASNVTSDNVNNLTDNDNNRVINDSVDLSTVPCAVSSYICVMESYNKTISVETGIKETHTVNNVTSVDGLVNALTNQGLKCNVIKTNSINDLKELHKDKRHNIILHMFIKNNYHYAHIKEVKKKGILFNNDLFIPFDFLKVCYTGISIIISNSSSLNFSCFGENVNKSKWTNITGKVTQRDLFNHYFGMVGEAIILNKEYVKLKANIKDESNRKGIESLEFILFGDTLKPKMVNLLRIQKQLSPVNNHNVSNNLLRSINKEFNSMKNNLNDTISSLEYLIKMINDHCNNDNLKSSKIVTNPPPKLFIDVPKLLDDGCKLFVNNLKESINNLNPLNAHPELREMYDDKYDLENHTFEFIDYYTLKKDKKGE